MSIFLLLIPDFAMIALGVILFRTTDWSDDFWATLEKLVYFVLFPALLFHSTAKSPLDLRADGLMLQVSLAGVACAIALGWLGKVMFRSGSMTFESGVQTAFRFNSYLALALAHRLGGEKGTALMAMIMGFSIPILNMAAVHALSTQGGKFFSAVIRNPMLLATAAGVSFNLLGLRLPEVVAITLSRVGGASIALGLILVGAGLRLSGLKEARGLAGWLITVKLALYPALAWMIAKWAGLTGLQMQIAVAYAALPTATTAYVLATRMGGNGPYVAFLISAGTMLSALTLPFWLWLSQRP